VSATNAQRESTFNEVDPNKDDLPDIEDMVPAQRVDVQPPLRREQSGLGGAPVLPPVGDRGCGEPEAAMRMPEDRRGSVESTRAANSTTPSSVWKRIAAECGVTRGPSEFHPRPTEDVDRMGEEQSKGENHAD
jgi:hypothetical protein